MSKRKPNKSVRFKFDVWRQSVANLTRDERIVLFELAVENWRKRTPCSPGWIKLTGDEEVIARLVASGHVKVCAVGYTAGVVTEMVAAHNRLPKLVWAEIRTKVFGRDNYACRYCGARGGKIECDHVLPLSRGGASDDENLVTACRPCNRAKSDRTPEEMGWAL